jgi:hypothetical protein
MGDTDEIVSGLFDQPLVFETFDRLPDFLCRQSKIDPAFFDKLGFCNDRAFSVEYAIDNNCAFAIFGSALRVYDFGEAIGLEEGLTPGKKELKRTSSPAAAVMEYFRKLAGISFRRPGCAISRSGNSVPPANTIVLSNAHCARRRAARLSELSRQRF